MRPSLHFTAQTGWINDPHGVTYRDGAYHSFFQYVPERTEWAPGCHWGHAVGRDLLSLREVDVAIAPGDGDDGIWTGSIVDDVGDVTAFYTATSVPDFGIGRIRRARPADSDWRVWQKGEVVVEAPEDLDLIAFRDPFVRREGELWRMFVGAAHRDGTAMALSWISDDLETWQEDGVVLSRSTRSTDPVWMGALWECPQFFTVGEVDVMVSSVWDADELHYAGYATGRYASGRFEADSWGRLTYGDGYYAPSLFFDEQGDPCLVFWIRGIGDAEAGWEGTHSIPFRLREVDGRLAATPHDDVAAHRGDLAPNGAVDGLTADIEWQADAGSLTVESGGSVVVRFERSSRLVAVTIGHDTSSVPVAGAIRVILDGPVLEVASGAGLFSARVAPEGEGLRVVSTDGSARVHPLLARAAGDSR